MQLTFKGSFAGTASLVFPTESAAKLVTVLTDDGMDSSDLDAIRIGTLTKVGNIFLNGVMGIVSNELKRHIRFSVLAYVEDPSKHYCRQVLPTSVKWPCGHKRGSLLNNIKLMETSSCFSK